MLTALVDADPLYILVSSPVTDDRAGADDDSTSDRGPGPRSLSPRPPHYIYPSPRFPPQAFSVSPEVHWRHLLTRQLSLLALHISVCIGIPVRSISRSSLIDLFCSSCSTVVPSIRSELN